MKETRRLKLTNWQLFSHYFIVPLLLVFPIMSLYSIFQIEVTQTYTGMRTTQEHLIVGLPWIIPALIFAFIQYKKLNFKSITARLSDGDFKAITEKVGREMNWNFISLKKDFAIAVTDFNWLSWGERITIIRKDDEILINSICDPDNHASVSSWGNNRKNINAFKNKIITSI